MSHETEVIIFHCTQFINLTEIPIYLFTTKTMSTNCVQAFAWRNFE